ncbi:unnamed protein product [Acanthoscelides obtectus]|uniref:Carboxylesterase type B domain-containing protein n=1 Tax=Acanthoscelides obtectus TaxID=200917 RepID=A0A9P0LQV3_ACAOB|nr:unnamed protein product [Acanthoscelides obtectus]CAK1654641.1 hypothetical protein AOBTE_LOCUS18737 [Acanthoscelides obtectus]
MSVLASILLLVITNAESKIAEDAARPFTVTNLGPVEGEWRTSFGGRKYASFEGIPYAKPPVGDLRFEEPQPVEPWSGIWNATRIYKCPQTHMLAKSMPKEAGLGHYQGEEDCLYLNVYVPVTTESKKLDVVVHIHGGAYVAGWSNEYLGEKYVMDRDIILVSLNYRIGALGFLSTEDDVVPGNNGLKDQTLALKWIQDNIEWFNGNPKSVTITGFSAGATSVHFHYLSSYSKGLFHRGMSLSGSALSHWAVRLGPLKKAQKLATLLGCETENTKVMVKCLKSRPASQIVIQTDEMHEVGCLPFSLFVPVVDKQAKRPFLEDLPENLLKAGKVLDVPWMASFNHDEGLLLSIVLKPFIRVLNQLWSHIGTAILHTDDVPTSFQQTALQKVKQHYATTGEDLSFDDLTKLGTDALMKYGVERAIKLQSAVVQSPVYYYRFGYEGQNSLKLLFAKEKIQGTCHGDDMVYFFGGIIIMPLSDDEIKMKDVCLDILYTYAHGRVPRALDKDWTPTSKSLEYHDILGPETIEVKSKSDHADTDFWKQIMILDKSYLQAHVKDEL